MKTTKFFIQNLKCHGCANTITRELKKFSEVSNVTVSHEDMSVTVEYDSEEKLDEKYVHKLTKLGYPPPGEGGVGTTVRSYVSCAIGRMNK